jgi:hypothetical protein
MSRSSGSVRWFAGADAVAGVEQKARDLLVQAGAHRELSSSLSRDAVTRSSRRFGPR